MAVIAQYSLFSWKQADQLGDLERLQLVLDHLPDEQLVSQLEVARGRGRNDYPVRALWNSILAGIVFQHPSIESLRRELQRNAQLRELCGFNPLLGAKAVPAAWVYSRFYKQLSQHQEQIDHLFKTLVGFISEELPSFGKNLACDSKAINSFARFPSKKKKMVVERQTPTGARKAPIE